VEPRQHSFLETTTALLLCAAFTLIRLVSLCRVSTPTTGHRRFMSVVLRISSPCLTVHENYKPLAELTLFPSNRSSTHIIYRVCLVPARGGRPTHSRMVVF
jgi:hypothetical protein